MSILGHALGLIYRRMRAGKLRVGGGWTADINCGSAAADEVTVRLTTLADFLTPADGWSFEKTSKGLQTVADVQFAGALSLTPPPVVSQWTQVSGTIVFSGGQCLIAAASNCAIDSSTTLVTGKVYIVTIDIETNPTALELYLGTTLTHSFPHPVTGVIQVEVTAPAGMLNNSIALITQAAASNTIVNSFSMVEKVGAIESASTVVSTQSSPSKTILFTLGWVANPTYGDVVIATYDGTGDYTNPADTEDSLGSELSPDVGFDGAFGGLPWTEIISGATLAGSKITMPIEVAFNGDVVLTNGADYRCVLDCESIGVNGVDMLIGGGNSRTIPEGSVGLYTINHPALAVTAQKAGLNTVNTGGTGVIRSMSIQQVTQVAVDLEAGSATLTNCLDV